MNWYWCPYRQQKIYKDLCETINCTAKNKRRRSTCETYKELTELGRAEVHEGVQDKQRRPKKVRRHR